MSVVLGDHDGQVKVAVANELLVVGRRFRELGTRGLQEGAEVGGVLAADDGDGERSIGALPTGHQREGDGNGHRANEWEEQGREQRALVADVVAGLLAEDGEDLADHALAATFGLVSFTKASSRSASPPSFRISSADP